MSKVRQRDVVWLRPACRPGDGRRPQVQTLPLLPEAFLVERIFGGRKSSVASGWTLLAIAWFDPISP